MEYPRTAWASWAGRTAWVNWSFAESPTCLNRAAIPRRFSENRADCSEAAPEIVTPNASARSAAASIASAPSSRTGTSSPVASPRMAVAAAVLASESLVLSELS